MSSRTPEEKTQEYLDKGRTLEQIKCIAFACGDKEWEEHLSREPEGEEKFDSFS